MKPRHINIPIFIPHLGCPHACVFCNQRSISGHMTFDPSSVEREIETVLSTVREGDSCEIAFFGGSFTGIDRGLMIDLLSRAKRYIDRGVVEGIRLSTRPDYIDDEILAILRAYGVRTVELGLQSLCDEVLLASERGHDAACGLAACEAVKRWGFSLIGQMMIGLPHATPASELLTAEAICRAGADGARVYPTVVFRDTALTSLWREGRYRPLSEDEAVSRTANVLEVFDRYGVPCIRVGLCASESLADPAEAVAGPTHAAIGEKAMNEVYLRRMECLLTERGARGGEAVFYVSPGSVSKAVGQKRGNLIKIREKYGLRRVKVLEKNEIMRYNIILEYFCL